MTYSRKRYRKAIKTNAMQNREYRTGLHTQIIPVSATMQVDMNCMFLYFSSCFFCLLCLCVCLLLWLEQHIFL